MKQTMKHSKIVCLILVLAMLVSAVAVGCSDNTGDAEVVITGVEDGKTYVLGQGDIKAVFTAGEGALSRDGGKAAPYKSGTLITEPGSYVLTVTNGSSSKSVKFTVKAGQTGAPVVSGVTDGQKFEYGQTVKLTFDKGTATLSRDGGKAEEYKSGTPITEVGKYELVVTHESKTTTVKFEITAPATNGQITDEFLTGQPEGYINTQDAVLAVEGNDLVIKDVDDANGYCLLRKEFKGVNVTENPCLEISVTATKNCSVELTVGTHNPLEGGPVTKVTVYGVGKGYLDVKKFARENNLDLTNTDLFIQIALLGQGSDSGKLSATVDYYKSVGEIPGEVPAGAYIDKTPETLSTWTASTAKLTVFDGTTQAVGTVTDPANQYGKVVKRVQMNAKLYPYLVIDVADVVAGWKLEALTYENNVFVGQRYTLVDQTDRTGKVEINLRNFFGEDECVDVLFELYLVGKSEEKFFTLNGLWTTDTPMFAPVISGIGDGDIYNVGVHGGLVPVFDKGTATLSKNGGAAAAYEAGTPITEAGDYTLTVKAGTHETAISFKVINVNYGKGVLEDFLTKSQFAVVDGTYQVLGSGNYYYAALTKPANKAMAMLSGRIDLDLTKNHVLVLEVHAGEGFDVGSIGIEILDDVNWFRVLGKGNVADAMVADAIEEVKDGNGKVVGYKLYIDLSVATKTDNSGATVQWSGKVLNNLKVTVQLEYGLAKTAILRSLSLTNRIPENSAVTPPEIPDDPVLPDDPEDARLPEDYNSADGFVVESGSFSYDAEKDEIVLTRPASPVMAKLSKRYLMNIVDGKYLVLTFETDGYTPDAGFSIELLDDVQWDRVLTRFPQFAKVVTKTLDNGRTEYTCYIDISSAVHISDNTNVDWTNKTNFDLKFTVQIEYGDTVKTVYLKELKQTGELPEDETPPAPPADPDVIEDYKETGSFTVSDGTAAYDGQKDEVVLTKPAGPSVTQLKKMYTLNIAQARYLMLTFEADSYVPDAGFSIEVLDNVKWDRVYFRFTEFAKVETTTLDNGRTQYVCYIDLANATHLADGTAVDWSNETALNVQIAVIVEYGDDARTVYLKELRRATEVPGGVTPPVDPDPDPDVPVEPPVADPDLIEDYIDAGSFTVSDGTAAYDAVRDEIAFTRPAVNAMGKLSKYYTLDVTQGKYLVLTFEADSYVPDAGFSIEVLDDVLWNRVITRYTEFAKVETTALDNGRTQYVCYMDISAAAHAATGAAADWSNETALKVKFTVQIEYGDTAKTVYLKSLDQTAQLPGEVTPPAEPEVLPGMIDDYTSADGYTLENGATATYDAVNDELILKKANNQDAVFSKRYSIDFAANGKYLVLTLECDAAYQIDAGFQFAILNDGVAPWVNHQVAKENFTCIKTRTLENGRTEYICYIEAGPHAASGAADLMIKIFVLWGGEKTVYLKSLYQAEEVPVDPIEEYDSAEGFTGGENTVFGYDGEKDEVVLTKPAGVGMAKLTKGYTLDVTKGKYLVLTFETAGYTPDAGFSVEILDDVNWDRVYFRFAEFAKVETAVLENGRTQYVCYLDIANATHLADSTAVDWSDDAVLNAKITVIVEYGDDERTVYLKSLTQTAQLPPVILDDYTGTDGFTGGESTVFSYDAEKDEIVLTKPAGTGMAKLTKGYTLDVTKGKYLVLTFEADSYVPDAGFSVEILDDVNWDRVYLRFAEFAKVETKVLASGRTQYVCYLDIANATHLADSTAVDWSDDAALNAKITVIVEYGDNERTVYLKSLSQAAELPAATAAAVSGLDMMLSDDKRCLMALVGPEATEE